MDEQKTQVEINYKEESISLKDGKKDVSKESSKKKKSKKIALENIDLGTKPINISSSKYDFLNYYNLTPSMKIRIKMISILAVVVIFFVILLTLKGKFHHYINDESNGNNNLVANQNISLNQNKSSSIFSQHDKNISSPSSSSKKNGL